MEKMRKPFTTTVAMMLLLQAFSLQAIAYEESFTYDGNGNLIQDGRFYYEYNGRNLLKRVRLGNETGRVLEEYKYRHGGQRGLKIVYSMDGDNRTTLYLSDTWEVHFNETGHKENIHYVFVNGERVAKIYENGSKIYYLSDHLGSSSVLVNENGEVVDRIKYRPFGAVRLGDNVSKYGYNSKELDDTGLLYYGARYYNPQLRRWTQADTLIPNVYDPQSLNRYSYVLNNPVKYEDEEGHFAWAAVAIPVVVGAAIGVAAYALTTDSSDWTVGGAAKYAAVGAGAGLVGVGLGGAAGALGASSGGIALVKAAAGTTAFTIGENLINDEEELYSKTDAVEDAMEVTLIMTGSKVAKETMGVTGKSFRPSSPKVYNTLVKLTSGGKTVTIRYVSKITGSIKVAQVNSANIDNFISEIVEGTLQVVKQIVKNAANTAVEDGDNPGSNDPTSSADRTSDSDEDKSIYHPYYLGGIRDK